jgi:RNA polymerase sigma-70 factor (ECF subfamily)
MIDIDIEEIKKAQKGDRKAFDNLITFYRQIVIDICYKYLRNREDALDMAQEVFYSIYNSIRKFEFKSKFSTWIYRICVNLCINKLDKFKRRKYYETESIVIHLPQKYVIKNFLLTKQYIDIKIKKY